MSDQVQVTFLTQLPLILGAVGILAGVLWNIYLSFRNGQKLTLTAATLAGQNVQAEVLHQKTAHIEHLVNSAADEMRATIVALRADAVLNTARIAELTSLCTTLQQTVAALHETIEAASVADVRAV